MNERIRELAEQARKKPLGDSWTYRHYGEFEEKFAELIVKECAKIVFEKTGPKSALNVLEHFGVEE